MSEIEQNIRAKLAEVESDVGVRVLHAVESGSRAWGFASPDSDYDVRFIYVCPVESYLRLERTRDVIEWQLDEVFDVNGWDLAKALRLLHDSNPTLFEWRASPIVYATRPEWETVSSLFDAYFRPKKSVYHYLSMARRNVTGYLGGDQVKLKKYFYVVRPLLACRWIIANRTAVPMLFSDLVDAVLPSSLKPVVGELLAAKAETSEMGTGPHIAELDSYIYSELEDVSTTVDFMDPDPTPGWGPLDDAFRTLVL